MDPRAEVAAQEIEWRRCATDVVYFVSTYCRMWTKEGGEAIDWDVWEFQEEALTAFTENRLNIVLKARQMGLSWCVCAFALWTVLFTANFKVYFQSIGKDEVAEQFVRLEFMYFELPEWMQDRVAIGGQSKKRGIHGRELKKNTEIIEFSNGSSIKAKATTKRSGQGAAPGLYILDEFAYNPYDVSTWRAVSPAASNNGRVIIISTANGSGNQYHKIWSDAVSGSNAFAPLFFKASRHPSYTPEFIEAQRREFPGDKVGWMQAYPDTPDDAFQNSQSCPFDMDALAAMKKRVSTEHIEPECGMISGDDTMKFTLDKMGMVEVWKHPREGGHYVIGADVALGQTKESGDFSVATVIDVDTAEVVAMFRARVFPEHYANFLNSLGRYYNKAKVCIERNPVSGVVIENIKVVYPWLYRQRVTGESFFDRTRVEIGFWTSGTSKPRIIANLRAALSDPNKPLQVYSHTILDELSQYEQNAKGGFAASGSNHDDCVMALALSVETMNHSSFTDEDDYATPQGLTALSY